MLTLKRKFFDNGATRNALVKLSKATSIPADTAYRIGKICTRVDREMGLTAERCNNLLKEYCKLDEKGNVVWENNEPVFVDKSKESEYDSKFLAIMDEQFQEKVHKIKLSDIQNVGLSPEEIISIEEILETDAI